MDQQLRQRVVDDEHLKLLRLGYLISAGITALFGCLGLVYVAVGLLLAFAHKAAPTPTGSQTPPEIGWVFVVMGAVFTAIGWGMAALKYHAAKCIAARQSWHLCMVVGGVCCLGIPYGTVLGAFTFLVLGRPTVHDQFFGQPPRVEPVANIHGGA